MDAGLLITVLTIPFVEIIIISIAAILSSLLQSSPLLSSIIFPSLDEYNDCANDREKEG